MSVLHPETKLTKTARKTLNIGQLNNPIILALIQEVERQEFLLARIAEIIGPQLAVHETSAKVAKFNAIRTLTYGES